MEDLKIKVSCPNCRRQIAFKIRDIVPGREKQCPYCNLIFKFQGDDGRKAQKALDNFEKTVKKLSKHKIKLKL